jgi:L-aspartate oxidase
MRTGRSAIPAAALGGFTRAEPAGRAAPADAPLDTSAVRRLMWERVGLFRDAAGLRAAAAALDAASARCEQDMARGLDDTGWERASLAIVAGLIARAALRRDESRGGHYRMDFPARDDARWRKRVMEVRG